MHRNGEQHDDSDIVCEKEGVAAFRIKEEEGLLQENVFPKPANGEGVNSVTRHESGNHAGCDKHRL